MRKKGKIVFWNEEKAYGFLEPSNGGKKIFAHITAFRTRAPEPTLGRSVSFEVATDKEGRLNAVKILYPGEKVKIRRKPSGRLGAFVVAALYFALLWVTTVTYHIPVNVLYWQLVISAITFLFYSWDKSAAQNDQWRTKESTLHLLAVIGGWPGALLAQKWIRHKSTKQSFRQMFWFTVIVNLSLLAWFHTQQGQIIIDDVSKLFNVMIDDATKLKSEPQIEWSRPR